MDNNGLNLNLIFKINYQNKLEKGIKTFNLDI